MVAVSILVHHRRKITFCVLETPGAPRAWVTTLHATQLVLKVHKEAVDSLSGSGSSTLGSVAAANETALECSKEIQAAMQVSLRNALNISAMKPIDGPLDDLTIMKQELLAYVNMLQTQLQRQQLETKQVFEEKTESTNGETPLLPMTKETEKDVDKACLSVSRTASMPGENVVHMSEDEVVGENKWNDIQATEARVSDVREISERDRSNSLDITVVSPESDVPRQ
ncbi:hypothetical protein HID58_051718 [Brassica napus]|uniref:Uncharacterized protein n=1 Tax=Brassica napus TaxID=3708 RepID=A0ABQ8A9T7_BRANA|nr:hypothetical protein HID58_051718 [Brassica napus]